MTNYQRVEVDPNDPQIQNAAMEMVQELAEKIGIGPTIALLTFSLYWVWMRVLHCETPMPEYNVANIEHALDNLKAKVMDHKDCALQKSCPSKVH